MAHPGQLLEDRRCPEIVVGVDSGVRCLAADQAQAADRGRGFLVQGAISGCQPGDSLLPKCCELTGFLHIPGREHVDRQVLNDLTLSCSQALGRQLAA